MGKPGHSFRHFIQEIFADPIRRLQYSLAVLVFLNIAGTAMYMLIEGWSFVDALYMTVITIATVGFGEVRTLSETGRIFTIVLVYAGVGAATSALSTAIGLALGTLLWDTIAHRRMLKMIERMENHYIVCGYGRMGRQVISDLQARGEPFVLIDSDPEVVRHFGTNKPPYIIGDATADDILHAANIEHARGLVAALSSDAANVMTVLTARELNPRLFIVARVIRPESESKLKRAGANRVVNPYQIGGHRIALSLLRPAVHDFLDHIFHFGEGHDIDIGQIYVHPDSKLAGTTIATSGLRDEHNVSILAIREADGKTKITPNPNSVVPAGAQLIIIGPPEAIYQLERTYQEKD